MPNIWTNIAFATDYMPAVERTNGSNKQTVYNDELC